MDNQSGTIEEAAEALMSMEPEGQPEDAKPTEAESTDEQPIHDDANSDSEDTPLEEEGESDEQPEDDEQSEEPEDDAEEIYQPETLDELAEAIGLTKEEFYEKYADEVKINGEVENRPLKDIKSGYLRQADYTRRLEEAAQERKAFEAEKQQAIEEFGTRLDTLDLILEQAESKFLSDVNSINWEELREEDPAEYAAKRQELQEQYSSFQALKDQAVQERSVLSQQQQEQQQAEFAEYLQRNYEALKGVYPEYSDGTKLESDIKDLQSYLSSSYGFEANEMRGLADYRMFQIAKKAKLYDALSDKTAVKKKQVKRITQTLKPGAKQSKGQEESEHLKAKKKRFKNTGSVDDAASILLDMDF